MRSMTPAAQNAQSVCETSRSVYKTSRRVYKTKQGELDVKFPVEERRMYSVRKHELTRIFALNVPVTHEEMVTYEEYCGILKYFNDISTEYVRSVQSAYREYKRAKKEYYAALYTYCEERLPWKNDRHTECSICISKVDNPTGGHLVCGHSFHTECIQTWFVKSNAHNCPNCRAYCEPNKVFVTFVCDGC